MVGIITTIITEEIMMKSLVGHVIEQVIYQQTVQIKILTAEMEITIEMKEEMRDILIILTLIEIQMKKIWKKEENYFMLIKGKESNL
jgi:hypothetical protein